MKRPFTLTLAAILQWVAAILLLITGIGLMLGAASLNIDSVEQALNTALANEGTAVSASAVKYGVMAAGLMAIIIGVIRAIIAFSLAAGHAWARIVITIFVVLALAGGIVELFQEGQLWRGVATIVVEIVILWLMWNARSSAYIAARTMERRIEKA
jgi:hypothetical protein